LMASGNHLGNILKRLNQLLCCFGQNGKINNTCKFQGLWSTSIIYASGKYVTCHTEPRSRALTDLTYMKTRLYSRNDVLPVGCITINFSLLLRDVIALPLFINI
jgi:hypothetical protein